MSNTLEKGRSIISEKIDKGQLLDWNEFYQEVYLHFEDSADMDQLKRWYDLIFNFSFLEDLPSNSEELLFHNTNFAQIKTKSSKSEFYHDFTQIDFQLMLSIAALKNDICWNLSKPFVSFFLTHKEIRFRVSLVHSSLTADNSPKAFFRVLNSTPIDIKNYDYSNSLIKLIKEKKNIIIAGATGSGKTTLTNSLINLMPESEHLLILEDTFELVSNNLNTTRLLSSERKKGDLDSLLTYGLRMSPDRIVLGEMRSSEVSTFVQAMNTGHKGMLTTVHANSAQDALSRVALLFLMYANVELSYELVLKLICQNIDHVVFIEDKKIKKIIDVFGSEKSQIFFGDIAS